MLSESVPAIFHVLRSLTDAADLARAAAVCRLWREVAQVPLLWQAQLEREHRRAARPTSPAPPQQGQAQHAPSVPLSPALAELLQPQADALPCAASQLRRWMGLRRLAPQALPLPGVNGGAATYCTASGTLVVFDQRSQRLAFVDLDRAGAASAAASTVFGAAEAATAGRVVQDGVECVDVPPPPPPPAASQAEGGAAAADGDEAVQAEAHSPEGARAEAACALQVLAAAGGTLVVTGHPDGRVLVWDTRLRHALGELPRPPGCGRYAVTALGADGGVVAAAYGGGGADSEVLVWDLGPAAAGPRTSTAVGEAREEKEAPARLESSELLALIKPSLATSVRCVAVSARHGVVALRAADGVELRAARGGQFLEGFADRRNTTLLSCGSVLFVASSSPSFLGNTFLDFEIEVAAVDLAGLAAAAAAAAAGEGGSGGGDGGVAGDGGSAAERTRPAVICRTKSPTLRYDLRGGPLSSFAWDGPMQAAASGGLLLLRCLQFPLPSAAGGLAWPGFFSFRMADLTAGLHLGRADVGRAPAATRGSGSGSDGGSAPGPAETARRAEAVADAAAAAEAHVGRGQRSDVADRIGHGDAPARQLAAQPGENAAEPPAGPLETAAPPAALPPPPSVRILSPEVLCSDGLGPAGTTALQQASGDEVQGAGGGWGACGVSSQLLTTPRHLVMLGSAGGVWALRIPHT
ncbi:hypothetical protein HYH03_012105 [Edaphochlamys debaryana]|uniref:F-box domain-containing protein n=1 Tax=Edaphochlamys debaryana TaxID=47281 RepID=A0A835Y1N0_9CHLO|nr:hypothetical protein HYH03_012105 [Edaphochlamys debaryana]|eukprot:KAG2489469.1 hypothetical protein HYH03_012105 [Edaphochlamys debaryana]